MMFVVPEEWTAIKAAEYACRVFHFKPKHISDFIILPEVMQLLPFGMPTMLRLIHDDEHFLGLHFVDNWVRVHPDEVYYLATAPIRKQLSKELNNVKKIIALLQQQRLQESQQNLEIMDTSASPRIESPLETPLFVGEYKPPSSDGQTH